MHSKYYGSRKLKQPIFGMEGVSVLRKHFLKKTIPVGETASMATLKRRLSAPREQGYH